MAQNDNMVKFKIGEKVVYAAHGVGQIEAVETYKIGGSDVSFYSIGFTKDRMRLKIPVMKAKTSGLRKLCSGERLQDALKTLQGRARIRRTMWSRRAQEYETKINSGDPISIAEVLRDLKRSNDDHEQSYSERQIYQSALERLAREVAAVKKITEIAATEELETMLTAPAPRKKPDAPVAAVVLKTAAAAKATVTKMPAAKTAVKTAPAKQSAAKAPVVAKASVSKTQAGKRAAIKLPASKASKAPAKAQSRAKPAPANSAAASRKKAA